MEYFGVFERFFGLSCSFHSGDMVEFSNSESVLSIDREGASELAINVEKETFDAYPQRMESSGR